MTSLKASSLCVRRGGKNILDDVSFEAHDGDFIALIGGNGAGKSTLLSVLSGLLKSDTGDVHLDGRSLHSYRGADLARLRAYLPQNPRCEWPISVERLIALGLTPSLPAIGGFPETFATKVETTMHTFDLIEHRGQPATTLSGGELTRAMLARALVGDPETILADEPISGLDPRHAIDTVKRLRALAESGKLVIAAVHDLTLAARFSTRILAMKYGRLAADGPTAETLTASLLSDVFEVEACVIGEGDQAFVDVIAARR
jgi:iron complex transport system ATP-binding protein